MATAYAYDMSVIVPVYNAEAFLRRCVASLDAQTTAQKHFEVVLVNDGSTDGSLELCRELASTRPNYVVLDQQNQGVSAARNAGMRAAHGRYLMFVDSDDTLSASSIACLIASFDGFGDAVDLVTYPLRYYDVDTGYQHRNARYSYFGDSGVYDLHEYPYIAQTTINVCLANRGSDTPLFDTHRKHYEDQVFNTRMLSKKGAIGYCAEAEYTYYREPTSTTMSADLLERSFDDVMSAFELFLDLARENDHFARYAHALVLYNVGWRVRGHKLFPDFGDASLRDQNYRRLADILRRVPRSSWEETPHLSDTQRLLLMQQYGVVGDIIHTTFTMDDTLVWFSDGTCLRLGLPPANIVRILREDNQLYVRGLILDPRVNTTHSLELTLRNGTHSLPVRVSKVSGRLDSRGVAVNDGWMFEVTLPLSGRSYDALRLCGTHGDVGIPAFEMQYELCRTNGRRIGKGVREFGDRRLALDGNTLSVGTIKNLPAWTMPAMTRLMRQRSMRRISGSNAAEVRELRERLPCLLKAYEDRHVWLYVDAPDALNADRAMAADVERVDAEDVPRGVERVAAFLGAECIVSGARDLAHLLPCSRDTWICVADFTRRQTYVYVPRAEEDAVLAGTPYDCCYRASKEAVPSITVLMPSLNVAAYIDECLSSVVNQTFEDLEILCIDAGSTDGTLEILRDYERRDSRVRVIISDQKSYGHQMNLGLAVARGAYVGVVETDDWIEPEMFEQLWKLAREHDADMVKADYYIYRTKPSVENKLRRNFAGCVVGQPFVPQKDSAFMLSAAAIWSGIYRRDLIERVAIRFNETPGASYQDTAFHFMLCVAATSTVVTDRAYLHYRRDNEASSVNDPGKVFCICDETRYFEQWLSRTGNDDRTHLVAYMPQKLDKYWWNYRRVAPEFQWEFLCVVRKEFVAHREAGLLDEANFTAERWQRLQLLLDEPAAFYAQTCKSFSAYPGDLAADVGEERLQQDALLRTYGLLGQAMALLAADDADPQRVDDAVRAVARAYRSLSRTERAKFAKRLSPAEQARLHVLLGGAREAKIAEMLAALQHPVVRKVRRVVTYPVRKARAFVRKRRQGE